MAEPVAIVGMACRLPGGIDGPAALWRVLRDGVDAVGEIPPDRFDAVALHDPQPATPGHIASTRGGVVDGIDLFDAGFFGIAPREAERLDPQQRLLLETSCEALDDAGVRRDALAQRATGVFVGAWIGDLEDRLFAEPDTVDFHMTTGTGRYALSGRLSYFLDSFGPSLTIDTACSSSLVAVHLAVQSLRAGECDLALAGGANVILEPSITIAYSQMRMMAPDGRCKFGDESADGYVRSDGAAMVALKRLDDAIAAGDRIHAVIRGSAVTNDGRSGGTFVRPGTAGHVAMLRRAYAAAGIDPSAVQYVEAHGTGTAAGDAVELAALGTVVGAGRDADAPCLVGSLKSNIGHTEGAAGVAGLIKTALALGHGEIPQTLHVRRRNPALDWDELGLDLCTGHRPWPAIAGPRRAGVSAFGISGTNAHVVLEAAPISATPPAGQVERAQLLALSAHDDAALAELAGRYRTSVVPHAASDLAALCAAAGARRTPLARRAAIVGGRDAMGHGLAALARGKPHPALRSGGPGELPSRIVFVFAGQGGQWRGMARDLLVDDAAFATAMADVDRLVRAEAGWSPVAMLRGDEGADRLDDIDVVQPLLFAVQVALAATWRSWGVHPAAVIGHSMGEVAAAHVAGGLSLPDAVAVICRRSGLLRRIAGTGAMAVVDIAAAELDDLLVDTPQVSVAVSNSPRSSVIAGPNAAIDALLERFSADGVFCRRVEVDVASHSPQVEPLLHELRDALAGIDALVPGIEFDSTVDGGAVDRAGLDAAYWARNLRAPVRFGDAVARQAAAGATAFVEIGPHPVLLPSVEHVLTTAAAPRAVGLASLRRDEPWRDTMLAALGALWVDGTEPDWTMVSGTGAARHVDLPAYPWQRTRHWHDRAPSAGRDGHPLLGRRTALAASPGTIVWDSTPGTGTTAYLTDHAVRATPILPASAFMVMCRAAVAHEHAGDVAALSDVRLLEPLPVDGRSVQLELEARGDGSWRCRLLAGDPADVEAPWRIHATATARVAPAVPVVAAAPLGERLLGAPDGAVHDTAMRRRELHYGPGFRTVRSWQVADGEGLAALSAAKGRDAHERSVRLLDGAFQLAIAALPASTADRTFVPVGAERVVLHHEPSVDAWATVTATGSGAFDVAVLDDRGRIVAEVHGLQLQAVGTPAGPAGAMFELRWVPVERPSPTAPARAWVVYAADALGAEIATQLRAAGHRCTVVAPTQDAALPVADQVAIAPDDVDGHRRLLAQAAGDGGSGIVYAWPAAIGEGDAEAAARLGAAAPLALLRAIHDDAACWIVTRGAQSVAGAPVAAGQAVAWGLARSAMNERPALRCTLVDLDPQATVASAAAGLVSVLHTGTERQLAIRDDRLLGARLDRLAPRAARPAARRASGTTFRLAPTTPGNLDGVRPIAAARRAPGPGEIELSIGAAGVNFLDVLKAMGAYPGLAATADVALGAEGTGVVVAVGDGVVGLAVGDEVVAITPSYDTTSLLASHVTMPAELAVRLPADLDRLAAAALPVAYVTALYALRDLARVTPGETVLVHAASGGVGLAAIEVCRMLGATVIATAGSEAKRAHVQGLGVEHVFDSRSTGFASDVVACTGGRGVNVVLNSLTGEAIGAGLAALAPRGRFVEIGKRDIHQHAPLDLGALRRNAAFFVLDLAALTAEAPQVVGGLLREVVAAVADGRLSPLPVTATTAVDAADAFRTMARAEHVGKLVVGMPDTPIDVLAGLVRDDRTYVITGGAGALGLAAAGRLVERGARHLAILGRSAPGGAARGAVADLEARGATVRFSSVDVTDAGALRAALDAIRAEMPPIAGVLHAAGQLADATIDRMSRADLRRALDPKLQGGWNLHVATLDDPLEMFVLFSSVAGVLGLAGQANYAAGNAFLDALAHERRRAGRPATSVAWGPWAEIGLAAADARRGDRLAARGLGGLGTVEALDALEQAVLTDLTAVAVMHLDAARWIDAEPSAAVLLGEIAVPTTPDAAARASLADRVATEPPGSRRRTAMEAAVRGELAAVVRVPAALIDRAQPLEAMGVDSLMALELRNRLETESGLTLSATLAFNHPTVAALAEHLADRLGLALDATDGSAPEPPPDGEATEIAADDLDTMLRDELAAVERLLGTDGAP